MFPESTHLAGFGYFFPFFSMIKKPPYFFKTFLCVFINHDFLVRLKKLWEVVLPIRYQAGPNSSCFE